MNYMHQTSDRMAEGVTEIGNVDWNNSDILDSLDDFIEIYKKRPILDNTGGMKAPHLFATWFMLKRLNPEVVIESGVWKGLGTWLIEKALPEAKIYAIDPCPHFKEYISPNAEYLTEDFGKTDWSKISNKGKTALFFDDHQDALKRIKEANSFGFKHLIFEDNYPPSQGDCYSLRKVFAGVGFSPKKLKIKGLRSFLRYFSREGRIRPNSSDGDYLERNLEVYYEFPPVYKPDITRWGDPWTDQKYPTKMAFFDSKLPEKLSFFQEEGQFYTWICYAKIIDSLTK